MASVWITPRTTRSGERRHRVEFRVGGRESATRYGGSFKTRRDADERKRWIGGELAARRVPDLRSLDLTVPRVPTLLAAYEAWQASRVDVSPATATYQRSAIRRAKQLLGRRVDEITADDVAQLVAGLAGKGRSRETIRKTVTVLSMVLDHAGSPRTRPVIAYASGCPAKNAPRFSRPPPHTSRPSTGYSRPATGCRCSCLTRPGCASASSNI